MSAGKMFGAVQRGMAACAPGIWLCLAGLGASCSAPEDETDVQTLLDRASIKDMMADLYRNVEAAGSSEYANYFTHGTVLEVNGAAHRGQDAILAYHREVAETSPTLKGTLHVLVSNLRVRVEGDTATAELYFTGVHSESPGADPRLLKHGREYDLLERQDDGRWRIVRRVIVSDASAQSDFTDVALPGEDFSILATP